MTTQASYLNRSEKIHKKSVWYAGSDAIKAGYLVCYDRDYGTAATRDLSRAQQVEKPSATNVHRFAGVVVNIPNGPTGPGLIEIAEPIGETLVDIYSAVNSTVNVTDLYLQAGSYIAQSYGAKLIGRSMQTVDRSSTNGPVLAQLLPVKHTANDSARSRTAVQLPTAAIWNQFPLEAMRRNPFLGSLLETDFTHGCPWFNSFVDATYAANAAGKTPTEHIFINTGAVGELSLFTTTDNQAAELQFPIPITSTGAGIWAFEVRIKQSVITDGKGNWFAGLMAPTKLVGDLIADTATLADLGCVGFQMKEGDGDKVDFVYDKTGKTQNEHDDDYVTQAADTYFTVGMLYNGTTIQGYVNGVATGTAISAADIAAADFPAAKVMVPTLAAKAGHADDWTVTVDWIRAAQVA